MSNLHNKLTVKGKLIAKKQGCFGDNCLDWNDPHRKILEQLYEKSPSELIQWINSGWLDPPDLTYAAETLGRTCQTKEVTAILLELLKHDHPLVREGALFGLQYHLHNPEVEDIIRKLQTTDPSPGVRDTAIEIIGE